MSKDSTIRTLIVTIVMSLVCSILVSSAAVFLKTRQEFNKLVDMQQNILEISGLVSDTTGLSPEQIFQKFQENVTVKLVDLDSGEFVDGDAIKYNQRSAANDIKQSNALDNKIDIASIRRLVKVAKVYLIEDDGKLQTIVFPVHGYGLWSTLYGFIALKNDFDTVVGLGFYEHGETPGLGGEVDNPLWKKQWSGKRVFDQSGSVALGVIKGNVDSNHAQAIHQVDGLAGASLTSRGVQNLVRFWLGEFGFGTFIRRLKQEAV